MSLELWRVFAGLGVPGVALGVLYFLFRKFDWRLPQVPRVWVGPLLLAFMLIVGGVTIAALYIFSALGESREGIEQEPNNTPEVDPPAAPSLSCSELEVDPEKGFSENLSDLSHLSNRTSEESPIDGSRTVKVIGSGFESALCIRLPAQYKPTSLTIQVRYKWNGLQDGNIAILGPECNETSLIIESAFSEYGDFRVYAPGETSYAKTNQERWYTVEFRRINWEAQSYDAYLDGAPVGRELSFSSTQSSMGCIVLYNRANSVSWWGMLRAEL